MKFNKWLREKYPYVNKYKSQIIIFLIISFITILIIIILAVTVTSSCFMKLISRFVVAGTFRNKNSSDSTNGRGNNEGIMEKRLEERLESRGSPSDGQTEESLDFK